MDDDATSDRVLLTLPGALIAQIDAQFGSGFVDREEFVRAAIRHYIEYLQAAGKSAGPSQIIG